MMDEPTEAQSRYLGSLKYAGEPPRTKEEASFVLDAIQAKTPTERITRELLRFRARRQREWFARGRSQATEDINQAVREPDVIVGFRLRIGPGCHDARPYDGAFVPLRAAARYPHLLPPYRGICEHDTCDCEFEEILAGERLPANTPMILRPNRVTTLGRWKTRELPLVIALIIAILVVGWVVCSVNGWL